MISFHIVTDYGAVRSRVPLSEVYLSLPSSDIEADHKQLWNCFSHNAEVVTFDYLKGRSCDVKLKNGQVVKANYLFTVDWYDNAYSEEPTDYKCAHVLVAEDGYLLAQPNNRILKWYDSNFVVSEGSAKDWKVDTEHPSVERMARWVSEQTNSYFYATATDSLPLREKAN
jgi:hypothetical protein